MDVGAAIKASHVVWYDIVIWKGVIIHLGGGSGFKEIVYQPGALHLYQ